MQAPTPGRLAYLARLTDAELNTELAQNERTLSHHLDDRDRENTENDRNELLDEMRRRPDFSANLKAAATKPLAALLTAREVARVGREHARRYPPRPDLTKAEHRVEMRAIAAELYPSKVSA